MALELPVGLGGPVLPATKLCDSPGTSLSVQWLGCQTFTVGVMDSICGWGTKILHAVEHK